MTTGTADADLGSASHGQNHGQSDRQRHGQSHRHGGEGFSRRQVTRVGALAAVVVALFFFYWWSVDTSGSGISFGGSQNNYFNQLATAFLHGHLSLLTRPPAALVHLSDPYNPALNSSLAAPFHDLILFKDHFYVSWGPTAALVLFIPWRILHIGDVTDSFAIVLFSGIGLAFAVATLYWLAERYVKGVRLWKLVVSAFALGLSSVTPYLMRRPSEYEVCISCAYCFLCAALWAGVSGSFGDRKRPLRIAFGSLCLGLAMLSRFDLSVLALLPVALVVWAWTRAGRPGLRPTVRMAVPYLLPLGVVILVLFAYNEARFGSPLQFGAPYELAGVQQTSNFNYLFTSIPPGLFYYLIAPIQFTLAFPYFALGPPPYYPWSVPNYQQTELVSGIFTTTPILVALLLAPFLVRKRWPRELVGLLVALVAGGLVIPLVVAWGIPGTTMRYEADFATLLLIPALMVWLCLTQSDRPRAVRWPAGVFGTLALLGGAAVGAGISITGPYDEMRQFDTGKYQQLGNVTDFIPTFVTMLVGHPMIVKDTYQCANGECGIAAPGLSHWTLAQHNGVEVDVVAPFGGWRLGLTIFDQNEKLHGSAVTAQVGNTITTFRTRVGQERIYLPLHQGLNRMLFDVPGAQNVSFYALRTSREPAPRAAGR